MCQISVCNLGDENLNKKLFLLMGTEGSGIHNDGWGLGSFNGDAWKCSLPMQYTSDAGHILSKIKSGKQIFLGHIRQASAKVPVLAKNAHPFKKDGIVFAHNGTLTPKDESKFVLEETIEEKDSKTGEIKTVTVKRSDSLVFFEEFLKHYKGEDTFVDALKETMELFWGKFAFVFIINKTYYIVRGKTADLHISYIKEEAKQDAKIIGWAVNTSKDILDKSLILLSNLEELDGRNPVNFTFPAILKAETIYKASKTGLVELGEIKENDKWVSTKSYYPADSWGKRAAGESNFTTGTTTETKNEHKVFRRIAEFMFGNSLSVADLQAIFGAVYGASLQEVTMPMLVHFCKRIIPAIESRTGREGKQFRKRLRRTIGGYAVMLYQYEKGMEYPWIFNSKVVQRQFVEKLEELKYKK